MNTRFTQIEDVTGIARAIMQAVDNASAGRTTYLRALARATAAALDGKGKPKGEQLEALRVTHESFYPMVMAAAEEFVPRGTKDRMIELHRRANFARTSASALRNHARAGGDIAALKIDKLTKASLKTPDIRERPPTAKRLHARVKGRAVQILSSIGSLAAVDKPGAIQDLRDIITQLSDQLASLGGTLHRDGPLRQRRPARVEQALHA